MKGLNFNNSRIQIRLISLVFSIIGAYFSVTLFLPLQFDHNPFVWFTANYYSQFIPFYIAMTLFIVGICIWFKPTKTNFYLAIFGLSAAEEILFDWIGLTSTQLPQVAIVIFFPLSLIAIWLGYFNVLKLKKLSVLDAIIGVFISTTFVLLPRYL